MESPGACSGWGPVSPIEDAARARWLLLIHQVPPTPDYLRVKVRRRLHKLHAIALKNSVYLLPNSEQALEDFQWLAQEIRSEGGEAIVAEASFIAGLTDEDIETMIAGSPRPSPPLPSPSKVRGRTWVTRAGVYVDRMASAWLVRRFIDPKATFKFVSSRGYRPSEGEVRFDMFEAEYTHKGDKCTFEVLIHTFELSKDRALRAIGEIVHDLDCKDDKFERPEAAGVAHLVDAIAASSRDDHARVERAATLFDDLYRGFK